MAGSEIEKGPQPNFFLALSGLDGPLVAIGDGLAACALQKCGEKRGPARDFLQALSGKAKEIF